MIVFEPAQGADREGAKLFMFRPIIDQYPPGTISSPPFSHRLVLGNDQPSTDAPRVDMGHAMICVVEQLPEPEQRLLGIAALLGIEVSVHEVARVADVSSHEVAITFAHAATLGILSQRHSGRLRFAHERIRETILASRAPTESLSSHARAAQLLTGRTPALMLRRAHHAFAAANRSPEDAATAVQIARRAAVILQGADDFSQAATVLGRAVELHEAAALPGPSSTLVVEWAEAVLACGHLAEARPLFHHAASLAEAEEDLFTLARAALGLSGVWVREHRLTEEIERVTALQQRALGALPPDATVLRARLTVRLAAESAYRGGPLASVVDAVDAARRTGDARAIAEALSLYHHALLSVEHTRPRLAVANELTAIAAAAGDRLLSLMGLCWRAVDLFLLGDPSSGMALAELRLRAETLRCRSVLFIVQAIEVMRTIRTGRFAQAEQAAAACYALGTEVGDADALAYYGAHLAAIRVFQGRETELADLAASLATSPMLTERDRAFSTAAALFALRRGEVYEARAVLEGLKRDGLDSIVPTSSWLLTMQGIIEIAAELKDEQTAQAAYNVLLPYAELPIMASLAVVCFGSAHRPLAIAALTCGKVDLAIEHFAAAVMANGRLGHRPATIQARAELALALIQRANRGDAQRGRALFQEAIAEAEELGMAGLIARWREALATTEETISDTEYHFVSISSTPQKGWQVTLGKHSATVPDLVGMRYLARLVAEPNHDIPALALIAGHETPSLATSVQAVMDTTAVTAIRARIRELRQQSEPSADEQQELVTLTHEFARVTGLGGRIRTFADIPERARTAVRKAVKRAIEQVMNVNPVIGEHLMKWVKTGTVCRYRVTSLGNNDKRMRDGG